MLRKPRPPDRDLGLARGLTLTEAEELQQEMSNLYFQLSKILFTPISDLFTEKQQTERWYVPVLPDSARSRHAGIRVKYPLDQTLIGAASGSARALAESDQAR